MKDRPFPWFCPSCGKHEVYRTTVSYTAHGVVRSVNIPALEVPKCRACGELLFDNHADDQINAAFHAQGGGKSMTAAELAAELREKGIVPGEMDEARPGSDAFVKVGERRVVIIWAGGLALNEQSVGSLRPLGNFHSVDDLVAALKK